MAMSGLGVRGDVAGKRVTIGSHRFFDAEFAHTAELCGTAADIEAAGQSAVMVHDGADVRGVIALADSPRAESREVVGALRQMGCSSVMLSGDNSTVAASIAEQVGVDAFLWRFAAAGQSGRGRKAIGGAWPGGDGRGWHQRYAGIGAGIGGDRDGRRRQRPGDGDSRHRLDGGRLASAARNDKSFALRAAADPPEYRAVAWLESGLSVAGFDGQCEHAGRCFRGYGHVAGGNAQRHARAAGVAHLLALSSGSIASKNCRTNSLASTILHTTDAIHNKLPRDHVKANLVALGRGRRCQVI